MQPWLSGWGLVSSKGSSRYSSSHLSTCCFDITILFRGQPGSSIRDARRYLLDILGPGRGVVLGHEHAVGQDGTHDEQAEEGVSVKEKSRVASRHQTTLLAGCPVGSAVALSRPGAAPPSQRRGLRLHGHMRGRWRSYWCWGTFCLSHLCSVCRGKAEGYFSTACHLCLLHFDPSVTK